VNPKISPVSPDKTTKGLCPLGVIGKHEAFGQLAAGNFQPGTGIRNIMYQAGDACPASVENDFTQIMGRISGVFALVCGAIDVCRAVFVPCLSVWQHPCVSRLSP